MLVVSSATAAGVRYWQRSAVRAAWLGRGASLLSLEGGPAPTEPIRRDGGRLGAEEAPADRWPADRWPANGAPANGAPANGAPANGAPADRWPASIDGHALANLLAGKSPGGLALTVRPGQRRRQGWDLVFGAPKSVSLLAAAGEGDLAQALRLSHRQAVEDAFSVIEESAAWVSSRRQAVRAGAVVAGAFEHLGNNAGQPHLHTHVVLANLGQIEDGRWGCLIGRELWRWREAAGACFQMALRCRLVDAGLSFEWELGQGGLGEVAGLAAVRARASSRSLAVRAGALRFGSVSAGASRVAQGEGRETDGEHDEGLSPAPDQAELQHALRAAGEKGRLGLPAAPPDRHAIERSLAERASIFREPDVLVALAENTPSGLAAREAATWARRFCDASLACDRPEVRGPCRRWSTGLAAHYDREVRSAVAEGRHAHLAEVAPALAWQELEALGTPNGTAAVAAALACSGAAVEALPRGPWLAQAACLDAARAVWQAGGATVQVTSPTISSLARWRALTSLRPVSEGGRPARRVLVVDAADHLGPAALARLVAQGRAAGTKLVLVPGGTVPGKGESMAAALDDLVAASALAVPVYEASTLPSFEVVLVPGLAVGGAFTGREAMAQVTSAYAALSASGVPALMVALGPGEAEALNLAARSACGVAGRSGEVAFGGRLYAPGEQVMSLRRLGPVKAATSGTVLAARESSLDVQWEAGPLSTIGHRQAGSLGYGYATTVPYLHRRAPSRQLLLLGDPLQIAGHEMAGSWVTVAGPGMPAAGPAGANARWRAAIAEIATGWPDEEMLSRAGPRPLNTAGRRRWAQLVTACALERVFGLEKALTALPLDRAHVRALSTGPGQRLAGRTWATERGPAPGL